MDNIYINKYIKYKNKYHMLKNQLGGAYKELNNLSTTDPIVSTIIPTIVTTTDPIVSTIVPTFVPPIVPTQ